MVDRHFLKYKYLLQLTIFRQQIGNRLYQILDIKNIRNSDIKCFYVLQLYCKTFLLEKLYPEGSSFIEQI